MIVVIEPVCQGLEHAPFNGALLEAARLLQPGGPVEFHAEPDHLAAVSEILDADALGLISQARLSTAPRRMASLLKRLLIDLAAIRQALNSPRSQSPSLIIIACATESTLMAAKIVFGLCDRRVPAIVVLHSALPNFLYSRKRRWLLSAGTPSKMRVLVLGSHIIENLRSIHPELDGKLFAISHPYVFDNWSPPPNRRPIKFGFLGLASPSKGFEIFLEAIRTLGERHPGKLNGSFHLIGRIHPSLHSQLHEFLRGPFGCLLDIAPSERMPRQEFRTRVSAMDYLVMPYNSKLYDLACSGSSLDAFAYVRPIIALRSSYFESLFDQAGDIGYLCDTPLEMIDQIEALALGSTADRLPNQIQNLVEGRSTFSPSTVAEQIRSLMPSDLAHSAAIANRPSR